MQPQEIPEDILNKGRIIQGVEEENPDDKKEEYLNKGNEIYAPPPEDRKEQSWPDYLRNFADQLILRSGEQGAGLLPDFAQGLAIPGKIKEQGLSYITPKAFKEAGIDLGQIDKSLFQYILEHNAEATKEFTSEKLREKGKEKWGQEYEPKDAFQRIVGNTLQDIEAAAVTPGTSIPRFMGASIFGNTVKEVMKQFNYGEGAQEAGKFTSMTLSSLINPRLVTNYFRDQYNLARSSVPNSHQLDFNNLERSYNRRINQWRNAIGSTEERAQAERAAAKAEELIERSRNNNGNMSVLDIFDQRRAINKDMQLYGRYYHGLVEPLRISLDQYGRNYNPVFRNMLTNADQAFGGYQASRRLAQNIKNFTHLTPQTVLGKSLLDILEGKAASISTLGVTFGAVKTYEMINRAVTNPTIRNLYFRTAADAANNNKAAFFKHFSKLEKSIQDYDQKKQNPKEVLLKNQ